MQSECAAQRFPAPHKRSCRSAQARPQSTSVSRSTALRTPSVHDGAAQCISWMSPCSPRTIWQLPLRHSVPSAHGAPSASCLAQTCVRVEGRSARRRVSVSRHEDRQMAHTAFWCWHRSWHHGALRSTAGRNEHLVGAKSAVAVSIAGARSTVLPLPLAVRSDAQQLPREPQEGLPGLRALRKEHRVLLSTSTKQCGLSSLSVRQLSISRAREGSLQTGEPAGLQPLRRSDCARPSLRSRRYCDCTGSR